jgi:GxxExxY protein
MDKRITQESVDKIVHDIIGCAIEIHKELGPGLLESAYEKCMIFLLEKKGFKVQSQIEVPITFRELFIDRGFRLDLLVEDLVIVELKAEKEITTVNRQQILTHLKLLRKPKGLLINFNCSNIFYEGQQTFVTVEYGKLPSK